MRRKVSAPTQREQKKFDFLTEVAADRLQLIGAITLAWNWIEGALDSALCMAADVHPDMWNDFTSRINGIDGKKEMLKKAVALSGQPELTAKSIAAIHTTIDAIGEVKRLRDGVIHARLTHPDALVTDTSQRRGAADEILISTEALSGLYERLAHVGLEMDWIVQALFMRHLIYRAVQPYDDEKLTGEHLRWSLVQLHQTQIKRQELPPLPRFPDERPQQAKSRNPKGDK